VSISYELAQPDRVTVGTLGPVGERVFVLQIREGPQMVTMKVEKQQVAALSAYLGRLLRDLERPGELPTGAELELEPFDEPDFVVGTIGVTYDESVDRIMLVADEVEHGDLEDDEPPIEPEGSSARLAMTREQAAALAIRGTELVESGRPPCPLCGYPLDPRGHACPRTNGNTAPLT
jgi:uncharacterized repeat protein (TIGR03847 family)